jgi:NAD(P)-dependent dehydrogenase (short-subunit alcohol dehydrogenase family)
MLTSPAFKLLVVITAVAYSYFYFSMGNKQSAAVAALRQRNLAVSVTTSIPGSGSSSSSSSSSGSGSGISTRRKSALIVGGTAGIGAAVARRLAAQSVNVVIVGRNGEAGRAVVMEMEALAKSSASSSSSSAEPPQFSFIQADVSLLANSRQLAADYQRDHDALHFLVMCPCMASLSGYSPTTEGVDVKLALHYYTRVQLAQSLLPLLRQTATTTATTPVVMSILSAGVHSAYPHAISDPGLTEHFTIKNAADAAGSYTDLAWDELARQEPLVSFVHAAPGFVASSWGVQLPAAARLPLRCIQAAFARSVDDCAEFMTAGLLQPPFAQPGFHLCNQYGSSISSSSSSSDSSSTTNRAAVWKHTQEVLEKTTK